MDKVIIEGLQVESVIGVYEWERHIHQTLLVDVEMNADFSAAAVSDALADAVDYAAIAAIIGEIARNARYQLLEGLAQELAQAIFRQAPVSWLRLTLRKPGAVPAARAVGVVIERSRNDSGTSDAV